MGDTRRVRHSLSQNEQGTEFADRIILGACQACIFRNLIVAFARVGLTNCLPVHIFNARGITTVAAWHTVRIGKRAKPVAKLGMIPVVARTADTSSIVPKTAAAPHKTANMSVCARSEIISEPLDVGHSALIIY